MKITAKTKLCEVIKEAATTAYGTIYLSAGGGERCLWGEAAHLCGLPDEQMDKRGGFGVGEVDAQSLLGMDEWDEGKSELAVELACRELGVGVTGDTVGGFRKFLTDSGYQLEALQS